MSHLMRPPDSREPSYSNPRFTPPNVRLPPPQHHMNRPPLSVSCFPPPFQYPRSMVPPLMSSTLPCPNPMLFPPPPVRPHESRPPPPQSTSMYSESTPPCSQLYNVPAPHSSSHPETPSHVYVPPYPPPAVPTTSFTERPSFPHCTDTVSTDNCKSFQPPSEPFHSNVQPPLPNIPYSVPYHHQDRKLEAMTTSGSCNLKVSEFVETPPYKRDEYQRFSSQGMPTDVGDESAYLKYKDRDRRRSDDRSMSRSGYDSRRNSDHLEYEGQHWDRFVRRRSWSPLRRGSPQRRRSRSPLNERRRSRSPLNERRRSRSPLNERRRSRSPLNERRRSRSPANERRQSRDTSRSSDQRPYTRECKWSRSCNSKDRGSRDRGSKSPGRNRQNGENKKCPEISDNKVSVNRELGSPARNLRYSSSPEYFRSHSRASLRRSSRSPNYKPRKRSRSYSPESLKSISSRATRSSYKEKHTATERELLLERWRMNYCANTAEMQKKLEELAKMRPEEIVEHEMKVWTRTAPADLYYVRDEQNHKVMKATPRLLALCERFCEELLTRAEKVRASRPKYELPPRKSRLRLAKHKSEMCSSSDSSSEESSTDEEDCKMEELERKQLHPYRLHPEMWYNDSGEMNDGPLCCCSAKARRYGIRHGIYSGENHLTKCSPNTNNADRLYHYRITISPPTNFLTKTPTIIKHDEHEFIFEGFSMFSHFPLDKLPTCKVIRFNIEYTILYIDEKLPENFTIQELDLFYDYLFRELLELVDLDFKAHGDSSGCSQFHFMPRFVRDLADNGKEILSMNEVMYYLIVNSKPLIEESKLKDLLAMSQSKWQNFADEVKGMVVTYPGMKPCSVRVDQLDRDQQKTNVIPYPEIVHFGIRPPQLSYAGNPEYQKAWREYVKFRHLLANMPKPSFEDKRKLESKENKLQEMRTQSKMKRDVTVAVSSKGFHRTGIMCDIIQHAMLIPVLVCHLRFHRSCDVLEKVIDYKFKNRFMLQLALTHPSYRENFGTNSDHARNSLTNCGIRQPEYGDRRIHYMNTRKRGINTLINIMSRFGKKTETESNITHNERLEFLGDAVVEFLTSIHLFHMFPDLEEGGLATYRAAIVQNQHLAVLAKILSLDEYMLYAHGSDLCHDLELRHAMANCFEALMGALFLDGGIEVADKVFAETLFKKDPDLLDVWVNYPPHPLQEQEPLGDRKWIPSFELLQNLTKFEESIGVEFKHIRLLARAFTDRSIGYTNLTLGSNQRLEFLGDTVLQLIASEYLYKFFPEHHEGHLSLLRSSLVNNRTQAVVCDDLGMISYALYSNPRVELKTKDRADLLEAFLGALYVDKGLDYCQVFCHVCFFPRLQDFIMNQDWNDPKSKLQQCCLTVRTMEGGEPDIPVYKVIECKGPTNTRIYTVAVYFRGERLAKASGHSIQQAEMNAAKEALELSQGLFPQLDHQKRVIAKSLWRQHRPSYSTSHARSPQSSDRETQSFSKDRSKSLLSSHQEKKTLNSKGRQSSSKEVSDNKPEPVPSSEESTDKQ